MARLRTRQGRKPPEEGDGLGAASANIEAESFSSTDQVFHETLARHGDVFPLPLPDDQWFAGRVRDLDSRRSRQRVHKRRMLVDRSRGTVWALNHLAGFDDESLWPMHVQNRAQAAVHDRVRRAHTLRAPPTEKISPQAALRQLLAKKAGSPYAGVLPGQLASYVRERLSLPRDQTAPVSLDDLLPEVERRQLQNFKSEMMLSDEEIAGVLEKGLENDRYMDPQLEGGGKKYHGFIADLVQSKLVGFTTHPRVQVGAFVVTKKAQKQRLIVDARRTNKLFRKPPSTRLGSMDSWARIELEGENGLFMAQEDVRDYFYRLRIDKDLGEYFCFPKIDPLLLKEQLGYLPEEVARLVDESQADIHPHMSVLPMGFAWAFHLAHMAHVELAARTLPKSLLIQDRRPAPVMGFEEGSCRQALLIYADNSNHLGVDRDQVSDDQQAMLAALHDHGLSTHDLVESSTMCESLGVRIDGLSGTVQSTPSRDHRLDQALLACSGRVAFSGEELQVLVGHMTMRALLRRGLLSVLRHVYQFIQECYEHRTRLWPSVVREIELFRCLMVLGVGDMRAEWSDRVFCTDACLSGYAVMSRKLSRNLVRSVGAEDERWRFYRAPGSNVAPRETALLGLDVFEDVDTVRPRVDGEVFGDLTVDDSFPEVPVKVLRQEDWRMLWRAPFRHKEPVHLLECRSILATMKHVARDSKKHGQRVLILNDNMGVVLAVMKGRCSSFSLLCLLRRIWAHSLASGVRLSVRWVASELNVADRDSRAWEKASRKEEGRNLHEDRGQSGQQEVQEPTSARCGGEDGPKQEPFANQGAWAIFASNGPEGSRQEPGKATLACQGAGEEVRQEDEGQSRVKDHWSGGV